MWNRILKFLLRWLFAYAINISTSAFDDSNHILIRNFRAFVFIVIFAFVRCQSIIGQRKIRAKQTKKNANPMINFPFCIQIALETFFVRFSFRVRSCVLRFFLAWRSKQLEINWREEFNKMIVFNRHNVKRRAQKLYVLANRPIC